MELTQEHRLTVVEDRSLRNEGRIKKLEGEHEVLHELDTSMAVMAEKQGRMGDSVERLEHKVDTLEDKPAQRWDKLISSLIGALGGAFLVWVASGMPGVRRSMTSSAASGVISRGEKPVPPVVRTRLIPRSSAHFTSSALIRSFSSGMMRV